MSFMNSCFCLIKEARTCPLTCFHRFDVLQDDLHPTVEHLYGAVLGDEVLGNWQRGKE